MYLKLIFCLHLVYFIAATGHGQLGSLIQDSIRVVFEAGEPKLFVGIDNPIKIEGSSLGCDSIALRIKSGSITRDQNCRYIVKTVRVIDDTMDVIYRDNVIYEVPIKISRISEPEVFLVGDMLYESGKISKQSILTARSLNILINVPWIDIRILSFELTIQKPHNLIVVQNEGAEFNSQILEALLYVQKGDRIFFENIRSTWSHLNRILSFTVE